MKDYEDVSCRIELQLFTQIKATGLLYLSVELYNWAKKCMIVYQYKKYI